MHPTIVAIRPCCEPGAEQNGADPVLALSLLLPRISLPRGSRAGGPCPVRLQRSSPPWRLRLLVARASACDHQDKKHSGSLSEVSGFYTRPQNFLKPPKTITDQLCLHGRLAVSVLDGALHGCPRSLTLVVLTPPQALLSTFSTSQSDFGHPCGKGLVVLISD